MSKNIERKSQLHPKYEETVFTCACGNVIKTRSTRIGSVSVEICSKCHPFYAGTQKHMKTGDRVARFNRRLKAASSR